MIIGLNWHINSLFNSITYKVNDNCLIDPGDIWEGLENINTVLLTHAHFDHIYGLNILMKANPKAKVYTNSKGMEMLLDARKNMSVYHETPFVVSNTDRIEIVNDTQVVNLGNGLKAKAVFTPGHNPSCITWIIEDLLFTGDAYIPGIKTVTNLPGGNKRLADMSIFKISNIARGRKICAGHRSSVLTNTNL